MEHYFELPIIQKGVEQYLKGRLVTFAHSYKFYIVADGQELVFERDDEGDFRALSERNGEEKPDRELLSAIVTALDKISEPGKST